MSRKAIVTTGVLAIALLGCGGSTKTVIQTVTAPTATTQTSSTPVQTTGPPPCTDLLTRHAEGKCVQQGIPLTIANRASTLTMKSLKARLLGVRTADSVSTPGASAVAHGRFVIVTLRVTNRLDSPQMFGSLGDQSTLLFDQKTYSESFDAENQADQRAFGSQFADIQPGESVSGDVVFDVPPSVATAIESGSTEKGAVGISDFGTEITTATSIGTIRLGV